MNTALSLVQARVSREEPDGLLESFTAGPMTLTLERRRESLSRRLRQLESRRENELIVEMFEQQLQDLNPPAEVRGARPKLRLYKPDENS